MALPSFKDFKPDENYFDKFKKNKDLDRFEKHEIPPEENELLGKKFGMLVVTSAYEQDGRIFYSCDCKCGGKADATGKNLLEGKSKNCGCVWEAEMKAKAEDPDYFKKKKAAEKRSKKAKRLTSIIGKKYGKLTVLRLDSRNKDRNEKMICRCDCGTELSVATGNLLNGNTKSCGCARYKHAVELGKKYNRLTVLGDDGTRSKARDILWKCRCDCGSIVHFLGRHIVNGFTKSCGCAGDNTGKFDKCDGSYENDDVIGVQFGWLTALRLAPPDESGYRKITCRCKCGNQIDVHRYNLKRGTTKSCGCMKKKTRVKSGQRYGRLSVIGDDGTRDKTGHILWHCRCDCGNFTHVKSTYLHNGDTKSCGCLRAEGRKPEIKE